MCYTCKGKNSHIHDPYIYPDKGQLLILQANAENIQQKMP